MNSPSPNDSSDEIFKAILEKEEIPNQMQKDKDAGVPTQIQWPSVANLKRCHLELTQQGQAALHKTTTVLNQNNQSYSDWEDKTNAQSNYKVYHERYVYRDLHRVQKALILNCTSRDMELKSLHNLAHRNKESRRFLTSLNLRWKTILKDINEYNNLIIKIPEEQWLRPLLPKEVKDNGLKLDAFWDINRIRINTDWATSERTRNAIDALLKVKRATEEISTIQLEISRVIYWVEDEAIAYKYFQSSEYTWMEPWILERMQHL